MNEQVLIKTINSMSQDIAQLTIDKHLFKAELEVARLENEQLRQQLSELQQTQEQETY